MLVIISLRPRPLKIVPFFPGDLLNTENSPMKGAEHTGKPLGGEPFRQMTFSSFRGFVQNKNRTIFGLDMAKNIQKPLKFGVKKRGGPYRGWRP